MESILDSIKKLLGIMPDYEHFDTDIIIHINNAFFDLNQLGVGPASTYSITDNASTWDEFFEGRTDLNSSKTYVYLKTKLAFDPPQMGYLVDSIEKQIQEQAWRLTVQIENMGVV